MDDDDTDDSGRTPPKPRMTARDLLDSEIVGMFADLDPELDSTEIARDLRERAWRRSR
jgi:hypothetical protein